MLEFYYDFLDHFVDRRSFELLQMDTDSLYIGIAGKNLDDVVRPEFREEFEGCKKKWLAWEKWSGCSNRCSKPRQQQAAEPPIQPIFLLREEASPGRTGNEQPLG